LSRTARFGILFVLLGLALAVIGIFVIGNIVRQSLTPLPVATPIPPVTEKVVVTTHDVTLGSVLQEGDLTVLEIPIELVPVGAMRSPDEVVGRMTRVPLVTGEMVLPHHLADPTNIQHDLAFVLGEDQVLMAFPAGDLLSQLNLLQPGDLVDILASVTVPVQRDDLIVTEEDQQQEEELFTFDALQRVTISAVIVEIIESRTRSSSTSPLGGEAPLVQGTPQPTPTPAPSQIEVNAILLALSPQDALVLKHLKDSSAVIDIVLRNPISNQNFELDPVMPDYLIDRYRLEVTR
jgi:pilus assembly protein CpaB